MEEFTDEQLQDLWHEEMIAQQKLDNRIERDELEIEFETFNWNINR